MRSAPRFFTREQMEDRRLEAVQLLRSGEKKARVSIKLDVSRTTVGRWHRALQQGSDLRIRRASGRPQIFTDEDLKPIHTWYLAVIYKTGRKPPNKEVCAKIAETHGRTYNPDHISRLTRRWRIDEGIG